MEDQVVGLGEAFMYLFCTSPFRSEPPVFLWLYTHPRLVACNILLLCRKLRTSAAFVTGRCTITHCLVTRAVAPELLSCGIHGCTSVCVHPAGMNRAAVSLLYTVTAKLPTKITYWACGSWLCHDDRWPLLSGHFTDLGPSALCARYLSSKYGVLPT